MTIETPSTAEALQNLVTRANEAADNLGRVLKAASKPLQDLSRKDALGDVNVLVASLQKLEKFELPQGPLKDSIAALNVALKSHLAEEERRLRFHFGRDLREAATAAGVQFAPLTSDPPEFRLGLFTLAVDLARRSGVLRYARTDLTKVSLQPGSILEEMQRQHAMLEGKSFDPAQFFEQVLQAYQVRLHRLQQPAGARVDLIDLLAEIAFIRQGAAFMEDPQRDHFVPYSRVQLAYDLARLRRAGKLSHRGLRLGLGSATAGTTKQKSRVLYLEDERGNGQWYLSIRFTREGESGEAE